MPEWTSYIRPHLAALRLAPGREAEILDEISQHLDARYEELLTDGATEAEAERLVAEELCVPDALAAFMQPLRQAHVPAPLAPGTPDRGLFRGFLQDLRIALRSLKKSPGFAATAVLTLALAIGANTAIFSVIHAVLIDPLAFPEPDRLVSILGSAPGSDVSGTFGLGDEFYVEYQENAKTLEDVALYAEMQTTMKADDHVERLFMSTASPSLFSTLRVEPVIGRLPTEEDEEGEVVVISHSLWMNWFGGDPSVLGRTFDIRSEPRTVVGVMGPKFQFPQEATAVWIHNPVTEPIELGEFSHNVVGRLSPGTDHESLKAELTTLARRLPERFGGEGGYLRTIEQFRPAVRSLEEDLVGNLKKPLWILMGTVAIVLLIACANVANLLIVRAESRRGDMAVRSALGAPRAVLIRSHLAEALLLAALGGVGGVLLAWVGVPLLVRAAPENIPGLNSAGIDATALLFTAGVTMIAAVASGFLPALRFSNLEIMNGLRNSLRVGSGPNRLTRDALVVVQTAAALVLLIGSGLLFQSFRELRSIDPGFDTEDIFTFQIAPDPRQFPGGVDGPIAAQFHYAFMDRMAALPGVQSVGLVNTLPLDEGAPSRRFSTERTEGAEPAEHRLNSTYADGDYFRTMGIGLLRGSTFARNPTPGGIVGTIVSSSAAQQLWPGEDALGKRLRPSNTPDGWMTVIGVVEDVMLEDFRQPAPVPLVYLPMVGHAARSWVVGTPAYVVKTPRAETIATEIRALLREYAPGAPMYRVFTMSGLAARTMASLSFTMLTLAIASGLALILGAVGIYGTLSYLVSQRTREIGIRIALGAQAKEVRRMIIVHGSRVVLIGVAIGVTVALFLTRLLEGMLFRVATRDWVTFVVMSAVMVGVALLASYIPAWRASSVDPIVSLRAE
jgi:putative ABC transport system permease protein